MIILQVVQTWSGKEADLKKASFLFLRWDGICSHGPSHTYTKDRGSKTFYPAYVMRLDVHLFCRLGAHRVKLTAKYSKSCLNINNFVYLIYLYKYMARNLE